MAQDLLRFLPVAGRVCLADALHTQTAFAQAVCTHGGHYLLTVKGNQPTLQADLATYFLAPTDPERAATTCDRRRGRVEQRTIRVTTAMTSYLSATWPHLAQVACLTRTVSAKATTHQEIVYLITSLPPSAADPHDLLTLIRSHWHIENGRHYVRDVTFGEDRSRVRSGDAPQILAALRNLAITLLHRIGMTQIAVARRHFAYHPHQAFLLIFSQGRSCG